MISISMKHWLNASERMHTLPTDEWYCALANKLLPLLEQFSSSENDVERYQKDVAISLSTYLQDTVSQSGGWKFFTGMYHELYGKKLPFYKVTDQYADNGINQEDIAFILWREKSHYALFGRKYSLYNPFDKDLLELSQQIYELMDLNIERAPICEEPSSEFWAMDCDLLEMPPVPLPEITPKTKVTKEVKHFLKYSDGKSLLYFKTYEDMNNFCIDVLKWETIYNDPLPSFRFKKNFVLYANAKGVLIAPGVAPFFCEAHNPMYDAAKAQKDGFKILCHQGFCPFDLLKYGMTKNILPDLQLPFPNGKEVLHDNWDFIARYYLCEYYEGE